MLQAKSVVCAVICAIVLSFSSIILAEDSPPQRFSVLAIEVNPGTAPMFEEFIRKYVEAAGKVENSPFWFADGPGIGPANTYSFARPFGSFGDLESEYNPLLKAFDQDEVTRLLGLAQQSIASSESAIYVARPTLSRPFPPQDKPPVATLSIRLTVAQGMNEQFEEYVQKVVEATDKVAKDVHWTMYSGGIGAPANVYGVRIPMWSWAELDTSSMPIPERLVQAFGKREGEKIWESGQDAITNIETQLSRFRVELSHLPPPN